MSRDETYLLDILRAARRAVEGLGPASVEEFESDWKMQAIVSHELLILGEAVKRLSEDFRTRYPKVPWKKAAGLRDVITHQYDRLDFRQIRETVHRDLPPLIRFLEGIAPEEED